MNEQERKLFEEALEGEAHFWWISEVGQYNSTITQQMWKAWQRARQAPASGEGEVEPVAFAISDTEGKVRPLSAFYVHEKLADKHIEGYEPEAKLHKVALYTHPPTKVPEGFTLKKVEGDVTTITITRNSDGAWCGGGIKGDDGANGVRYEFLNALLTTPTPATTPETDKEYDPADDPLFQGADVTVEQALDAMEDEYQLDEKHCYTTPETEWVKPTGRKHHDLKTDPSVFRQSLNGVKAWEIRRNDRDFVRGDTVTLHETENTGEEMAEGAPLVYTGRQITGVIGFVLNGPAYGLNPDWCVFSLLPTPPQEQ